MVTKKSLKLFVKIREKKGAYIASIPMKKLLKYSKSPAKSKRWSFELLGSQGGWLILEAF